MVLSSNRISAGADALTKQADKPPAPQAPRFDPMRHRESSLRDRRIDRLQFGMIDTLKHQHTILGKLLERRRGLVCGADAGANA